MRWYNTIFPRFLWNPDAPRAQFYERYRNILPRLRSRHRANVYGTYFGRMISYSPAVKGVQADVNQLEQIIQTRTGGNPRRSALQLALFDPTRDHTNQPRRGFPCLHQVAFCPYGPRNQSLWVSAFYAVQHVFCRAYGNYLGLARLGEFVAHETGLELRRLTCYAGIANLGNGVTKGDLNDLATEIRRIVA